jgi:hypothetical protein
MDEHRVLPIPGLTFSTLRTHGVAEWMVWYRWPPVGVGHRNHEILDPIAVHYAWYNATSRWGRGTNRTEIVPRRSGRAGHENKHHDVPCQVAAKSGMAAFERVALIFPRSWGTWRNPALIDSSSPRSPNSEYNVNLTNVGRGRDIPRYPGRHACCPCPTRRGPDAVIDVSSRSVGESRGPVSGPAHECGSYLW